VCEAKSSAEKDWALRFYEKVIKVKADVAAILNFFSRSIPQIEADHSGRGPAGAHRGDAQGGFQRSRPGPQRRMKIAVA
jgi:hypothetical protein